MTISYSWLKEYIDTKLSADKAAAILTDAGLEIEGIEPVESIRGGLAGLVVGRVLTCAAHPDSDHLSLTTVDVGTGAPLSIVCGAPNVAANQLVIVATVGAKLYPVGAAEGFAIKKSKIRGVESFGMLCAEDEIGVGTSHDGIIVLDDKSAFAVGTPAAEVFNLTGDTIFEVGLTPNRVDAASHYGVARDLAASLSLADNKIHKALLPSVTDFKAASHQVMVEVKNSQAAPRYMGVAMSGITIAPSPEWLQTKLRAIGINPKNNVVDITNFVLYECGAPLHAFDLDKVKGRKIIVQTVDAGTKLKTLDGVERSLAADDLVICNAENAPMCLAGVFGGADSGVSDTTTSIFIESAYFNPTYVRRTAKRHGLSTDSSWRYERGADPEMLPYALKRCALLVSELAGGKVVSDVVDIYPEKIEPFQVVVDLGRINRLIGKDIPMQTVETILTALEIEIIEKQGSEWKLRVPTYRVDVQREADIAEEILRIYGFNNIENPPFIKNVLTRGNMQTTDKLTGLISNMLTSLGLSETMSNSLTRASYYDDLKTLSPEKCVKIINPLSQDLNVMRQTLLFNMLEAVQLNVNRKNSDLKFYEVGNCYFYNSEFKGTLKAYHEKQCLGIMLTGRWALGNWNTKATQCNFFSLKSLIEKIFDRLGLNFFEGVITETPDNEIFDPSISAVYTIRREQLFEIGQVASAITDKFDIKAPVFYAELNIAVLQKLVNTVRVKVSELSKFQPVSRDLALLVDKNVSFAVLSDAAMRAEKKSLRSVTLFDVYTGDKLPADKKSYALNFVLEDTDKTLTDHEIDRIMGSITATFAKLGATLRV
ncbi:MAG: phenylalanine--tRNA ligase subunit beta [Mucinivorans sp.]